MNNWFMQKHSNENYRQSHELCPLIKSPHLRKISAKIIIFHNTADCKHLECYKTHDNHYLIEKPSGFFRSAYLCNCYETYKAVLSHKCKLGCNVCFTDTSHRHLTNTKKCDCKRICKSHFCFKQHKMMEKMHNKIPCNTRKYCEAHGSVYAVRKEGKTHKCRPLGYRHCS